MAPAAVAGDLREGVAVPRIAKKHDDVLSEDDVDPGSLLDNPRNPKQHPEDQIQRLMASLTALTQYRPVLARKANRMLIAGHGVRMAVQRLGWPSIRVAFWDVDQGTADRAMLGDNRLAELGRVDDDRIAELLRDIPETDWLGVGFAPDEARGLLDGLTRDELEVREIETGPVDDTFWINISGPLKQQADVLQRTKQLMSEYPAITIELGTIGLDP